MGRFGSYAKRVRTILVLLLLVPLAAIFLGGSGVSWPDYFGGSGEVEAGPPLWALLRRSTGSCAYEYLKKICEIGPRTAGSAANARQRKLVADHFQKMGGVVSEQKWQIQHPQTGQPLVLANLIGSWHPERAQRVVIAAHYDTRPHPDEEPPNRQRLPFIGANDGGSGVALLMEMAHHLTNLDTQWGVDLVLFDGEELVYGNNPRVGQYFLGSEEFARRYADQVNSGRSRPRYLAGIVLDMVGGRNLQIKKEPNSLDLAPGLVNQVWSVAGGAQGEVVQAGGRPRGAGRSPRAQRGGHPHHRSDRFRLSVLAQG